MIENDAKPESELTRMSVRADTINVGGHMAGRDIITKVTNIFKVDTREQRHLRDRRIMLERVGAGLG